MTEYTIFVEDAGINFCASVIGFDRVITTGKTIEEVVENMREAIPFHLEGMRMNGDELPKVLPNVRTVEVLT